MPSIADIRRSHPELEGYSDPEVIDIWAYNFGLDRSTAAADFGIQINAPGFTASVKRGLGQMVGGAGEIVGDVTGDRRNAVSRYADDVTFRNPAGINSLQDAADDPWLAFKEAAGQGVSFLGPQIGLSAVGKGLGALGYLRAGRAVNNPLTQAAMAGAPSLHEIGEKQRASGLDEDFLYKYGGAGLVGTIENLGGAQRMLGLGRRGAAPLTEMAGEFGRSPLRTFGKQWLRTAGEEALEEVAQTPIEQMAGFQDPTTSESLHETAFGGVMGGLGGLALGPIGGAHYALAHNTLVGRTGMTGLHAPQDLLARAEQMDREDVFAADPYYHQLRGEYDAQQARFDDYAQSVRDLNPNIPTQAWIDQSMGIGHRPPSREGVRAAFNAPIDPTVVVGPDGVPYTTTREADVYDWRHRGAPAAGDVTPTNAPSVKVEPVESSPAAVLLQSAGLKPTNKRVALVSQALDLQQAGLMTQVGVTDVVNLVSEHKNYSRAERMLKAAASQETPAAATAVAPQGQTQVTLDRAMQRFTGREKEYWKLRLHFANEGEADARIAAEMKISPARVLQYKRNTQKKLASALGMTPEALVAQLKAQTANRTPAPHDMDQLGMHPAQQQAVMEQDVALADEEEAGPRVLTAAHPNQAMAQEDARTRRETAEADAFLAQHPEAESLPSVEMNADLSSEPVVHKQAAQHDAIYGAAEAAWEDTRGGDEDAPTFEQMSDQQQEAWIDFLRRDSQHPGRENRFKVQERIINDGFYSEEENIAEAQAALRRALAEGRAPDDTAAAVARQVVEGGARTAKDFAGAMLDTYGAAIQPHLRGLYESARAQGLEGLDLANKAVTTFAKLPKAKALSEVSVTVKAELESGETVTVRENAEAALREIDRRLEFARRLLECVGS